VLDRFGVLGFLGSQGVLVLRVSVSTVLLESMVLLLLLMFRLLVCFFFVLGSYSNRSVLGVGYRLRSNIQFRRVLAG
jgi:hypothetical protein